MIQDLSSIDHSVKDAYFNHMPRKVFQSLELKVWQPNKVVINGLELSRIIGKFLRK